MPNRMKPETLEQARARLKAMSDAEKAGVQSISEGQLVAARGVVADEGSIESEVHQRTNTERARPAANDLVGDSVNNISTRSGIERPAPRKSAVKKAASKTSSKAVKKGSSDGSKDAAQNGGTGGA